MEIRQEIDTLRSRLRYLEWQLRTATTLEKREEFVDLISSLRARIHALRSQQFIVIVKPNNAVDIPGEPYKHPFFSIGVFLNRSMAEAWIELQPDNKTTAYVVVPFYQQNMLSYNDDRWRID